MRWFLRYGPAEASRRPPDATTVALATRAEGFAAACETSNPGRTGNAHGRPLIGMRGRRSSIQKAALFDGRSHA
jgi:hypothetical protein